MILRATLSRRTFQFNFRARTSRGLMRDKTSWFIILSAGADVYGIGECGPLPGLSVDHSPEYDEKLHQVVDRFNSMGFSDVNDIDLSRVVPAKHPSILFGLETAVADLAHGGKRLIFDNGFVQGQRLPINGLVWMGDLDFLMGQINIKVADGFRCLKLKVGGLDFERECDVLHYIRNRYYREEITLKLDANGAFKVSDALYKLEQLARFDVHSIEQPIKAGSSELAEICRRSPIPVALDEELIGVDGKDEKTALLDRIQPQFIVLKPMLHGGLGGCEEWIHLAEERKIGWWITSSLESSIGLNAICQFTANYEVDQPQGLGTGKIYKNNFESPLEVSRGEIFYDAANQWEESLSAGVIEG